MVDDVLLYRNNVFKEKKHEFSCERSLNGPQVSKVDEQDSSGSVVGGS